MNDSEFMLEKLRDGRSWSTLELIQRSIRERGCGLTPHSRASDLRRRGHHIDCEFAGKRNGRPIWIYTLRGSLPELSSLTVDPLPRGTTANDPPHVDGRDDGSESEQPALFETPRRPEWA